MERVARDAGYREELAQTLLARCGDSADHVELRRMAMRIFPELARNGNDRMLGTIVGQAATLRVQHAVVTDRDVTDARLEMTATQPLAYPATHADMSDGMRATVIAFCEAELGKGHDGPQALSNLLKLHGWPYSERTFYVGPWKAARFST